MNSHKQDLEFSLWFKKKAKSVLKDTLKAFNKAIDEQLQINEPDKTHGPFNLPFEYLEYQINNYFRDFKDRLIMEAYFKSIDFNLVRYVKNDLGKTILPQQGIDLIQLARLSRTAEQLKMLPQLAFLDIETDTLNIQTANILQIAIIKPKILQDASIHDLETFSYYTLPYKGYTEKENLALHINNIGKKQLAEATPFSLLTAKIYELLEDTVIVGYNSNSFDIPILKRHMEANSCSMPHKYSIDLYPACWKNKKQTLADALHAYRIPKNTNSHDATADASCCIDLLFELVCDFKVPQEDGDLLKLSDSPSGNTWKYNSKIVEINSSLLINNFHSHPTVKRNHSDISSSSTAVSTPKKKTLKQ
jgi:DNA polymerase III epsilon subunit-like protein